MKTYTTLIMILFCLCEPWSEASARDLTAEELISNVNDQLRIDATAKVSMKIKRNDKIVETKGLELLMNVNGNKESVKGKIFEPANRRGTLTTTWVGGRASIGHVESGRGKERKISARLKNSFLGSGMSYVDIRVLEDTDNYEYSWLSKNTIKAISKDIWMTVYWKRILTVEKKEGGLWIITKIKYYNKGGRLVKVRENKDFVKAYKGWRPRKIVVKKRGSAYITSMNLDWESPTVFD